MATKRKAVKKPVAKASKERVKTALVVEARPKKEPVLRVDREGVRLSRVQVSPEGVVLKVLS